jgi:hypothetical protein
VNHCRWRQNLGPPLLAAAAAALLIGPTLAMPGRPRVVRPSPVLPAAAPASLADCAVATAGSDGTQPAGPAWYRLDPVPDAAGQLDGQRLVLGETGRRSSMELWLAVESFASGPTDGRVLVGTDDGRRSLLRILDVAGRCATIVHDGPDLVRRAILEPSGMAIVEFRLDRETRADLGVWRRPLEGQPARRILDPLPSGARIGLVFATELAWSDDGRRLVVTSCGAVACLTRVVDRGSGEVTTVDDPQVGEPIGLLGDELVAYGGCPSLPCEIVSRNLVSGRTRVLAELTGLATVTAAAGGLVVHEDYRADGRLTTIGVDGTRRATLTLDDGLRLIPAAHRALAAIELRGGLVAAAADGRPATAAQPATFIDAVAGRPLTAEEIVR